MYTSCTKDGIYVFLHCFKDDLEEFIPRLGITTVARELFVVLFDAFGIHSMVVLNESMVSFVSRRYMRGITELNVWWFGEMALRSVLFIF